jgi:hypothetical protein
LWVCSKVLLLKSVTLLSVAFTLVTTALGKVDWDGSTAGGK